MSYLHSRSKRRTPCAAFRPHSAGALLAARCRLSNLLNSSPYREWKIRSFIDYDQYRSQIWVLRTPFERSHQYEPIKQIKTTFFPFWNIFFSLKVDSRKAACACIDGFKSFVLAACDPISFQTYWKRVKISQIYILWPSYSWF